MTIEEIQFDPSPARLADLRQRVANAHLPHDFANADWSYGMNGDVLRDLLDYWRDGYDWDGQQQAINSFKHHRVTIDDVPVHFIREPGRGPAPMPIILSHGWPWSFWDLHRVIRPLADPASFGGDPADAFEVIVPSMPGFGLSTPLTRTGINFWSTADLWHKLMTQALGFPRYAAQGGDWGALTTTQLGHKYADELHGIHISTIAPLTLFNHERPWDITAGNLAPKELPESERRAFLDWQARIAAHVCVQVLDPQTLAYALHDSPVGLLAWLVERRHSWGDCREGLYAAFDRDFLITTAMIYWLTDSFVTSARFYAEAARNPWQPSHTLSPMVQAPTGISHFTHDGTTGLGKGTGGLFNLTFERRHDRGGHFAPIEVPDIIIEDVRAMFRPMRQS
ncbi:alpha/beta fold hydrolase [Sphingobium phenoxybenzoativorans]|uniref:Alpha/beta fold hydrolase n=1 Tax=Sphingobium phenoxybenzoativorans TaxID=1592790 RepID=A0A975K4V5_9SPHN|nr:epoxide hydrolase [Sphingobium phenoxybenzoativorans]QUT04429.1 alpha/beta fold hydrolase [Sphingobium phenoxybenzoativorans]